MTYIMIPYMTYHPQRGDTKTTVESALPEAAL